MKKFSKTGFLALTLLSLYGCGAGTEPAASDPKIVGGHVAEDRPFMAGLISSSGSRAFCGGTFIRPDVVMTAAHCVDFGSSGLRIAGGHRQNSGLTRDRTVRARAVEVHERYDSSNNDNDIALVFLDPAELPRLTGVEAADASADMEVSEQSPDAIVSGWGTTSSGGSPSTELLEVTVPMVDRERCRSAGGNYRNVTERQVCAGDFDNGGIDSCQGDSGGPLFVQRDGRTEVIGIVSWGEGCAARRKMGVYTRVASFTQWITDKIEENALPARAE